MSNDAPAPVPNPARAAATIPRPTGRAGRRRRAALAVAFGAAAALGHVASAEEGAPGASAATPDLDAVRERLEANLPGMRAASLDATPVPGLFEAVIDGTVYYVDESGEYLVDGSLVRLSTRENLTEARLGTLHMAALADARTPMLTYEPENPTGRSITVFTDISCGYCRKLHAEIDTLLDAGVAVNYLLFPRAGLGSEGAAALESVWCNADPQAAMTTAKAGGRVPDAECENPIEEHVALAERVGLRGTPLIYTDAGERIPGYREPAALVQMIEASEPWTAE